MATLRRMELEDAVPIRFWFGLTSKIRCWQLVDQVFLGLFGLEEF